MAGKLRFLGLVLTSAIFGGLALGAPTLMFRALSLGALLALHMAIFMWQLRLAHAQTAVVFSEALTQLSRPTEDQRTAVATVIGILLSVERERISIPMVNLIRAGDFTLIKELDDRAEAWVFRIEKTATAATNGHRG